MNDTNHTTDIDKTDVANGETQGLLPSKWPTVRKENILKRCLHDRRHRRKVIRSVCLGMVFIALGLVFGQSGPALLDMQILTGADLETASFFLTAVSLGGLFGSVLCGVIYDRVNKNLFLLCGALGLGLLSIIIPYCTNVAVMIVIRAVYGVFSGVVDAAGNAEQMRVWGNEGEELMQMLHFFFAIGGVISPLYTGPFLAQQTATNTSAGDLTNSTNHTTVPPDIQPTTTDVKYAFIITGVCCIVSGIPWLVMYVQDKMDTGYDGIKAHGAVKQRMIPLPILLYMISMICLLYFLYCCAEVSFTSFLMTFLVEEYKTTKSTGAQATSIFYALFGTTRFLMIFISQYATSVQLLFISSFWMIITSICFTISAMYNSMDGILAFTALIGISVSAVFPAGFSWTERQLMRVTSRITAAIHVSASVGGMVVPLLTSYLMQGFGNMWFCYLLMIEIVLMCLVFLILYVTARFFINKHYHFVNEGSEM